MSSQANGRLGLLLVFPLSYYVRLLTTRLCLSYSRGVKSLITGTSIQSPPVGGKALPAYNTHPAASVFCCNAIPLGGDVFYRPKFIQWLVVRRFAVCVRSLFSLAFMGSHDDPSKASLVPLCNPFIHSNLILSGYYPYVKLSDETR